MDKTKNNGKIGLVISLIVVSIALIIFIILFSISAQSQNNLKVALENTYQRNFTELVDNVNNADVKMSKVVASSYNDYAKNILNEISKNTAQAASNLSSLPISINGIDSTIKFINQVSGYTQIMAKKIDSGTMLTSTEIETLKQIKSALSQLKDNINSMANDIYNGNIFKESNKLDGDYNSFTTKLKNVKADDVDYPTMIYDGPFSDATLNKKIKNLNESKVSENIAKSRLENFFKNVSKQDIEYLGETDGKFETYDYKYTNTIGQDVFIQITKNGGCLLTVSAPNDNMEQNYSLSQAKQIAVDFVKSLGVNNIECTWSDIVNKDAYLNLAPTQDGVILYPDLIKVKVDLATGSITGYEASSYYTNHIKRTITNPLISEQDAKECIPTGQIIESVKLVLAPIEYQNEKLCYEILCNNDGDTFYYYVNAESGEVENILKILKTDNGNLLM